MYRRVDWALQRTLLCSALAPRCSQADKTILMVNVLQCSTLLVAIYHSSSPLLHSLLLLLSRPSLMKNNTLLERESLSECSKDIVSLQGF